MVHSHQIYSFTRGGAHATGVAIEYDFQPKFARSLERGSNPFAA
jgi:hypothetical protein